MKNREELRRVSLFCLFLQGFCLFTEQKNIHNIPLRFQKSNLEQKKKKTSYFLDSVVDLRLKCQRCCSCPWTWRIFREKKLHNSRSITSKWSVHSLPHNHFLNHREKNFVLFLTIFWQNLISDKSKQQTLKSSSSLSLISLERDSLFHTKK